MTVRKVIRNLIIGKHTFIESHGEFKQVMLSGQYALIAMFLCMLYSSIDIIEGVFTTLPVYSIAFIFLSISIVIHRKGEHCIANYFLLPTINITVYIFASSESPTSGAFIFFISTSLMAFAVFSYKQRLLSILFAAFTYTLFIAAYFVDYSLLPKRIYSDDMILLNVVINFTVALPSSVMAIYLMISLNHYNAIQLLASNKMLLKTNAELDRFVYSTSHDLRAPLSSILGLIDIASRNSDPIEVRRYLGMMKDRIYSLDKFIRDITDYSRNNRLKVQRERLKLHELAVEIWESLKFSPEAENIKFELDIPENTEVESDKNRLTIVLGNLISNAIRYHDLRKEERFIRLKHHANSNGFYIKVEDNGQGISKEYHTKIFEMFYRANEKSKGSGLGLYIVKETLLKLSGSIHIDSSPGVGTVFTVKVPY